MQFDKQKYNIKTSHFRGNMHTLQLWEVHHTYIIHDYYFLRV